jgi:hypothetical protein
MLGVGLLLMLAGGLVWLAYPWPRATPENFRRLRLGMTRAAVEHILGRPNVAPMPGMAGRTRVWDEEGFRITLRFSDSTVEGLLDEGDMTSVESGQMEVVPLPGSFGGEEQDTFISRLRRLLPW